MNVHDNLEFKRLAERVTALEAKVMAESPIYREPTIEDADELCKMFSEWRGLNLSRGMIRCLKQLNFVRKVQP